MSTIPTIKDVAASAGVSIGTVSNVLHGKATMYSKETADRVAEAIAAIGYRPNHVARSLARRCTQTFGVAVRKNRGLFTTQPYHVTVLEGMLERAADAGYHMKIILADADSPHALLAQLEDGSMDGVAIVAPRRNSPLLQWAQRTRLATVIVSGGADRSPVSRVDVDDSTAVYEAVSWLIAQGHRRIGLLGGPATSWSGPRRERGYRRALLAAGLRPAAAWHYAGDYSAEAGRAGALALRQVRPALTALVCGNDRSALAALSALQQSGVRVPEDMSVLGFDDIEGAAHSRPALTTIHHPVYEIGVKAAELLLEQLNGGGGGPTVHLFPGSLVVRDSVAPPAARNGHNGGGTRPIS